MKSKMIAGIIAIAIVGGAGVTGTELKARIQADYDYLRTIAPAHLFGESKNPLAKFDSPKIVTRASSEPIRIRKTCCYYYQASDEPNDYCSSCPKLQHEASSIG